ncbi:unnamed protein product [Alopecurus aequalis]
MLSRALAQMLGKGTKRPLDLFVQTSSVLRRSSIMQQQIHHLHLQPEPTDSFPPKQHPLPNSIRAPPTCIFESNWTMRRCFSTMDNSDDTPLDSKSDSVGQRLVQRLATLKSIGDCFNEYELMLLLKKKSAPVCYVWCDPSPWMHLTQGLSVTTNVNKMIKAGFKVKVLMADWFTRMDNKIGGNLCKIQTIARYNIEVWKATGMDLNGVEFVLLSDEISGRAEEFWPLAMHIASTSQMGEITRCLSYNNLPKDTRVHESIDLDMIREITPAETMYACLQCASILLQEADVWLFGMDQRGVNMLAGEYCKLMGSNKEPLALFNNTVHSLLQHTEWKELEDPGCSIIFPQIFMDDGEENISRKIEKAFCPPKLVEGNPCLEYVKYIILPWMGKFEVILKGKKGGMKTFLSMEELTADYSNGALRPAALKQALVKSINIMLQPVRYHFRSQSAEAKELAKAVEDYYIMDKANGQHLVS